MTDLQRDLNHLTGGRLDPEELTDLTNFVYRKITDAKAEVITLEQSGVDTMPSYPIKPNNDARPKPAPKEE